MQGSRLIDLLRRDAREQPPARLRLCRADSKGLPNRLARERLGAHGLYPQVAPVRVVLLALAHLGKRFLRRG